MTTTSQDPEDMLDMLGVDEEPEPVKEQEAPPKMDLPPLAPRKSSLPPHAAGGADADFKLRLEKLQKTNDRLEQDKVRLERQAKTGQEAEKRLQERVHKLEAEVAAAKEQAAIHEGMDDGGDEALRQQVEKLAAERDLLTDQVGKLQAQVAAAAKGGGAMALPAGGDESGNLPSQGLLDQIPYARILVRLMKQKFTGRLTLKAGNAKRDIFFDAGAPVAYSSSEPGERLGRVLVAQSIITEEQYLAAARAMVEKGAKLTEALLEMGAIDAERLQEEQRQLTRDQILSGFAATNGTFTLDANKAPPEEVARFEFRVGEIFLQGYRKYAPESEVKGLFSSMQDAYVCLKPEMGGFRAQLGLDNDDDRLLKMMGEAYTLGEAVERSGLERDRAARLLAALSLLGLVERWKPGVAEFESRLRAEKLRHAEETLTLKTKLHTREEELLGEFQKSLERLDEVHAAVQGIGELKSSLGAMASVPEALRGLSSVPETLQGLSGITESLKGLEALSQVAEGVEEVRGAVKGWEALGKVVAGLAEVRQALGGLSELGPLVRDVAKGMDGLREAVQAIKDLKVSAPVGSTVEVSPAKPARAAAEDKGRDFSPERSREAIRERLKARQAAREGRDGPREALEEKPRESPPLDPPDPPDSSLVGGSDGSFSPSSLIDALGDSSATADLPVPSEGAPAEDGPGSERFQEGTRLAAEGNWDDAEVALREAVRLDASQPSYLVGLANVLLNNPRYERSGTVPIVKSLLERAQALAPDDAEVAALLEQVQ